MGVSGAMLAAIALKFTPPVFVDIQAVNSVRSQGCNGGMGMWPLQDAGVTDSSCTGQRAEVHTHSGPEGFVEPGNGVSSFLPS